MRKTSKSAGVASASGIAAAAKTPEYQRIVAALENLCGVRRWPLAAAKGGFLFKLKPARARAFELEKVHDDFLQRGAYVFDNDPACERGRIGILPTTDPYDAIRAIGTAAPNWNLETKKITAWLRRLEKDQPFLITGISDEHVSGRFTTRIKRPADLAMRLLEFAPDLENPVVVEELLRASGEFCLWWD